MATGIVFLLTSDSDLKASLMEELSARAITVEPAASVADLWACRGDCQGGGFSIVVDVASLGPNPVSVIANITAHNSPTPIIVLIQGSDVPLAVDLMRAGAFSVLEKCSDMDHLVTCIESAFKSNGLAPRRRQAAIRHIALTDSEQEVLRLTLAGASNKEIARELDISLRTVAIRRAKLVEKLGARNRAELIRLAIEAGLCRQDGEAAVG